MLVYTAALNPQLRLGHSPVYPFGATPALLKKALGFGSADAIQRLPVLVAIYILGNHGAACSLWLRPQVTHLQGCDHVVLRATRVALHKQTPVTVVDAQRRVTIVVNRAAGHETLPRCPPAKFTRQILSRQLPSFHIAGAGLLDELPGGQSTSPHGSRRRGL